MAKLNGFVQIEGTIQEMTFYKSKDGYLVKSKSGVSKQRIETDPKFARTRENGEEFGNAASAGKLVRDTLRPMMLNTADGRVTSRLTQVMSKIKNMDTTSVRGKRTVAIGIANPAAIEMLKGFSFNESSVLGSVLFSAFKVDATNGVIEIDNFVPLNNVVYPEGATNVAFTAAFAKIDFSGNVGTIEYSPVTDLPIDATPSTVTLKPVNIPAGTGTHLYLLHISFYQKLNGFQYPLKNGSYNVLSIVDATA